MTEPIIERTSRDFAALITRIAKNQVVVWDFDGVVADTEPLQDASYRILAERRGWSPDSGYFTGLIGKTEDAIWAELVDSGFPLSAGSLPEMMPALKAERKAVFVELAESTLPPSWVARTLMPAFDSTARSQVIVSNGDPDVIESMMRRWRLAPYVHVARREAGRDKAALLEHYCNPGAVLLEDNDGWLRAGKHLGATTIGVIHEYNTHIVLAADYLVRL